LFLHIDRLPGRLLADTTPRQINDLWSFPTAEHVRYANELVLAAVPPEVQDQQVGLLGGCNRRSPPFRRVDPVNHAGQHARATSDTLCQQGPRTSGACHRDTRGHRRVKAFGVTCNRDGATATGDDIACRARDAPYPLWLPSFLDRHRVSVAHCMTLASMDCQDIVLGMARVLLPVGAKGYRGAHSAAHGYRLKSREQAIIRSAD